MKYSDEIYLIDVDRCSAITNNLSTATLFTYFSYWEHEIVGIEGLHEDLNAALLF